MGMGIDQHGAHPTMVVEAVTTAESHLLDKISR